MSGAAALIAHGGGLTQVMNASLAGVIEECRRHPGIEALYGARYGIPGAIEGRLVDLYAQDAALVEAVAASPGSALGSSRSRIEPREYERLLDLFRARNVRYFFYTGGNGSMHTAAAVERMARDAGYELRVIGIPKTIDNDLIATDHCPGYGSAARFFASAVRDIGADIRELPGRVSVIEAMGRNAGWVVASGALARSGPDDPPHIVYVPERPVSQEQILEDVNRVYTRLGYAVIAVSEGQRNEAGEPFGADMLLEDPFHRGVARNLAHTLAELITRRLKLRARSDKPGILGRASAAYVSATDREEARECGRAAVRHAAQGVTGKMVTLVREELPYLAKAGLADLDQVAAAERHFPEEWIAPGGNDVLPAFVDYAAPLTGTIEPRPRLDFA